MNKDEIVSKSKSYSKDKNLQRAYIAGFQTACNIVKEKIQTCYNEDFCDEMEELSQVAYIDFDE